MSAASAEAPPQGYYAASAAPARPFPRLSGTATTDICIVGGGYTGLSAALHLAEAGAQVALVEARTIGHGASGRNGGQIHTGLRKDQSALEKWLGPLHARELWSLSEEAKALVRTLVAEHRIDCALTDGLVIAAHNRRALQELAKDTAHLARHYLYAPARMMDADESAGMLGTTNYPGARLDLGGGHLHPLSYARGLAAAAERSGAVLWEHSAVLAIESRHDSVEIQCGGGRIRARQALLAAGAFNGRLAPELEPFIGHVESFIIATEPLPPHLAERVLASNVAVADTRHVLDYYRKSTDGRLLFAGRESYFKPPADIAALVRPRMIAVFPHLAGLQIDYAWSGTVGITASRMPHLGTLSERILFAHGYSGQGVALATLGGRLMAEAAMGRRERFDVLARIPAARFPGGRIFKRPLIAGGLYALKWLDRF